MNPLAPQWLRPWDGGRVRISKGREVFVIERRIGGGNRRAITLDVDTEKAAMAELALFESDPVGYRTRKHRRAARKAEGIRLDPDTLKKFEDRQYERVAKGDLTATYVKQVLVAYLEEWATKLGGRDLRTVDLMELKKLLKGWKTAEHKRVVALKAFTAWAREEEGFKRADDPTLDLKTPEIVPAKSVKAKGYPIKLVEKLYAELPSQHARDTICLRAKTGMHDTEIDRIAQGDGQLLRVSDPSGIEGVAVFRHLKKGKIHAVSLDAQAFAAAERLQARGFGVSRNAMKTMIDRACRRMGLKDAKGEDIGMPPGELRHSYATWATTVGREVYAVNQKGVDLAKVAEAMGHMGKRTTSVFYVGDRIPMMIAIPITLEHPEDPIPMAPAKKEEKTG